MVTFNADFGFRQDNDLSNPKNNIVVDYLGDEKYEVAIITGADRVRTSVFLNEDQFRDLTNMINAVGRAVQIII